MKAFEFSTTVTPDGKLIIPEPYAKSIAVGNSVRVIVLLQENNAPITPDAPETAAYPTIAEVVEEIRRSSQNPDNVEPASGLLAEHLANSPETPDPAFDAKA